MEILLGSDPELFVFKDGQPISAHGMVEGSKEQPQIVKGGAVQVDGMALEYNTNPSKTLDEWERHHVEVQRELALLIDKGLTLEAIPTAHFSEEVFDSTPKEALILGCEPDFNAYSKRANPKPDGEVKFRTGAGHIHIGWGNGFDTTDPFHLEECYELVKALDLWLGVPSVIMDKDNERRELYGKAGAFRPKEYGLEYRTLSNFWVKSEKGRKWAYESTMRAIKYAMNENVIIPHWVRGVINGNRVDNAKYYSDSYNLPIVEV